MSFKIRCSFRPQAWVNDWAIDVDIDHPNTWEMKVKDLPKPNSDQSDVLAESEYAPAWVQTYSGPFEVDYEVIG